MTSFPCGLLYLQGLAHPHLPPSAYGLGMLTGVARDCTGCVLNKPIYHFIIFT